MTIISWAAHHPCIRTTANNKHSYVNTWISIVLLVSLFTTGVYQTENSSLCQGIGIALHYLSSCVLLWIIVSVTNLYKKVTKALRPPLLNEDPPPDIPLPPKPMLRFYLVGWGIAMILCGISAAVNLHQYAGYSYCFLAWGPSLGAFYAPCVVLVAILGVFCLLTHCMLKSVVGPATYSEAAATTTDTTELELLDQASPNSENPTTHSGHTSTHLTDHHHHPHSQHNHHNNHHSTEHRLNDDDELSIGVSESSGSVYDTHHSPLTQLRSHEVTLILFVLTWASAAITTAAPFDLVIPYHTTIFSLVYAVCATSLGAFVFLFFCFGRTDVKEAWKETQLLDLLLPLGLKEGRINVHTTTLHVAVPNNASSSGSGGSGVQLIPPISNANAASNNLMMTPNNNISNNNSTTIIHHHNNTSSNNITHVHRAGPPSVHSLDSSLSPTNKSSSVSHQVVTPNKNNNMVKPENNRPQGTAMHLLNMGSVSDNLLYSPEMFYNPKQACVAKRFFQKQRLKQMVKQNNLGLQQRDVDSDCNSSVLYRPRPARSNNSGSDVSGFDPSCLGASSKVNNTNIHVDHNMYSYMSRNKQADKTPTPELLCVFGPNKDYAKESDDTQKRSFSRSPNQTDHIPRIDVTNAYQYSSESSYQTPTHQRVHPLRHKDNIEVDINSASYRCHNKLGEITRDRQRSPFNYGIAEESETILPLAPPSPQQQQQQQSQLVHSKPLLNMADPIKIRQTRVRHKRAKSKGGTVSSAVAAASGNRDDWSDDNHSAAGMPLDSLPVSGSVLEEVIVPKDVVSLDCPADALNTSNSSLQLARRQMQSDCLQLSRLTTPSPQQTSNLRKCVHESPVSNRHDKSISPALSNDTTNLLSSLVVSTDATNPNINKNASSITPQQTGSLPPSRQGSNFIGGLTTSQQQQRPHQSWPHVLAACGGGGGGQTTHTTSSTGGSVGVGGGISIGRGVVAVVKRHNIPWHEDLQAVTSWDSETGEEMSCCEGGGEKRFSTGDMSDQLSVCCTDNTSRNSMCSDVSVDGSSIGTSLVAGIDTSPPASLLVSDSPFDSPLHRLHQNTPDDASVASSSVTSPLRRPFSPSNFPYFRNDGGLGVFGYELGYEPPEHVISKRNTKKMKCEPVTKSYSTSPVRETTPTNIPESSSVGQQLSNLASKKRSILPSIFSKKSKNNSKQASASKTKASTTIVPSSSFDGGSLSSGCSLRATMDPIMNVNFQFSAASNSATEEDDEDCSMSAFATDRSSSISTEPQQHMLMTTPRSEGSSDSEYNTYPINQEQPINFTEDLRKAKKRVKKNKRKGDTGGSSSQELCSSENTPLRDCLGSSTPTPSTPLLALEEDVGLASTVYPRSQYPLSPPPLAPFYAPPPPQDPYQPLSTSTPVRHDNIYRAVTPSNAPGNTVALGSVDTWSSGPKDKLITNLPSSLEKQTPYKGKHSAVERKLSGKQSTNESKFQVASLDTSPEVSSISVSQVCKIPKPHPSPVPVPMPKPIKASVSMPIASQRATKSTITVVTEHPDIVHPAAIVSCSSREQSLPTVPSRVSQSSSAPSNISSAPSLTSHANTRHDNSVVANPRTLDISESSTNADGATSSSLKTKSSRLIDAASESNVKCTDHLQDESSISSRGSIVKDSRISIDKNDIERTNLGECEMIMNKDHNVATRNETVQPESNKTSDLLCAETVESSINIDPNQDSSSESYSSRETCV